MTKFQISFDSARHTPAEGLPDRAFDDNDKPLEGSALIAACTDHFSATAKEAIPGIAIRPGPGSTLDVIVPKFVKEDVATDVLKSIPGPHTMQLVPAEL